MYNAKPKCSSLELMILRRMSQVLPRFLLLLQHPDFLARGNGNYRDAAPGVGLLATNYNAVSPHWAGLGSARAVAKRVMIE